MCRLVWAPLIALKIAAPESTGCTWIVTFFDIASSTAFGGVAGVVPSSSSPDAAAPASLDVFFLPASGAESSSSLGVAAGPSLGDAPFGAVVSPAELHAATSAANATKGYHADRRTALPWLTSRDRQPG